LQRVNIRRRWYRTELKASHFIDRLGLPENQKLLLVTLLIGAVCGLVAVAFHILIRAAERNIIRHVFVAAQQGYTLKRILLTLLIPALGGLAVGLLLHFWVPDARGSGVPQVKVAFFFNQGRIPFKSAIGKMTVAIISLGTGASIGREGPTVQICAAVSSFLGRFFSVSRRRLMEIIPVGSAAAVAAAFNTPIAAVTFAFEEIIGDLNQRMLGGIVIAAVLAAVISRGLEGPGPIFTKVPAYGLNHPAELIFYVLLGVIVAGVAVFFSKVLLKLRLIFRRMRQVPSWLKPAIGGLAVGFVGLFVPQAMGGGYDTLSAVLKGNSRMTMIALATIAIAKIVTTVLSYGSGGSGGIFAPSLFIGAMVGGAVGYVVDAAFPNSPTAPGAFALVGMGAMFCGVIRAPITSVLIIFEMTSNYTLILPLMIANAVSYIMATRLQPVPIYEALLAQDGIHLPQASPVVPLNRITTGSAMTREVTTLPVDFTVREAFAVAQESGHHGFPIMETRQGKTRLFGFITSDDLEQYVETDRTELPLRDVAVRDLVIAHPADTLDQIMLKFGQEDLTALPVVTRTDPTRLVGILTMRDVVRAQARQAAAEARKHTRTAPRRSALRIWKNRKGAKAAQSGKLEEQAVK
jgi:CIC family chloride channel protein